MRREAGAGHAELGAARPDSPTHASQSRVRLLLALLASGCWSLSLPPMWGGSLTVENPASWLWVDTLQPRRAPASGRPACWV